MVSQEINKTLPTGLKWWAIRLKLLLLFIFNAAKKSWQTEYLVDHNQVAVQMITWIQSSRDLKFTTRKQILLLIISITLINWSKLIQREKLKKFLNSCQLLLKNWIDKQYKKSISTQKIKTLIEIKDILWLLVIKSFIIEYFLTFLFVNFVK